VKRTRDKNVCSSMEPDGGLTADSNEAKRGKRESMWRLRSWAGTVKTHEVPDDQMRSKSPGNGRSGSASGRSRRSGKVDAESERSTSTGEEWRAANVAGLPAITRVAVRPS
jgi:hypothetical protein